MNTSTTKVLVLFGGKSTEHLVSCRSAFNIMNGLQDAGYKVIPVGITQKGKWGFFPGAWEKLLDLTWEADLVFHHPSSSDAWSVKDFILAATNGENPDVVFPAVHGINCEDGSLQGLLELADIPYVGSGVLASALMMDKLAAKELFKSVGIPQCKFLGVSRIDIETNIDCVMGEIQTQIGLPCFLKPSNGGSSVGTIKVDRFENLENALHEVAMYDRMIVVEEFVTAREIEVAVLGNEPPKISLPGEIVVLEEDIFYDYQTKYFSENKAKIDFPASLTQEQQETIQALAQKAYILAGAKGLSRIDFFVDKHTQAIYLNEINTLPGFTAISLYPRAWQAMGIELPQLTHLLVKAAQEEFANKKRQEIIG